MSRIKYLYTMLVNNYPRITNFIFWLQVLFIILCKILKRIILFYICTLSIFINVLSIYDRYNFIFINDVNVIYVNVVDFSYEYLQLLYPVFDNVKRKFTNFITNILDNECGLG